MVTFPVTRWLMHYHAIIYGPDCFLIFDAAYGASTVMAER